MNSVTDIKNKQVKVRGADEGRKHVEKAELKTHGVDTLKYVERKLVDRGVGRLERHPADGLPLKHDPKKGHGGKYTWEDFEAEAETAALDEKEEADGDDGEGELVVGEVDVAKTAAEGVARIEVDPHLKLN